MTLSHHFDTPTAREDPRLNLCDFYLFAGAATETTAMVMTVNPDAKANTVAPFRSEAIYAFRFDTDDDHDEEVSFKVRFAEVAPSDSDADDLGQSYEVRRADHQPAGLDGDPIASARINQVIDGMDDGVRAFAGVVDDPFAGDAAALEAFKAAFAENNYRPQAFSNRVNFFHGRTIGAIVLEVPNRLIASGTGVHAWATVSLYGHAPEQQVARWGLPLLTHLYLGDVDVRERFNRSRPSDDNPEFIAQIVSTVRSYAAAAGTTDDPVAYGNRVAKLFGSLTLPYELGSTASFDYTGINGRSLRDNVMDTMLSLLTNSPLGTGIAPDPALVKTSFPYLRPAVR